jgi:putative inorganic carbon (HCO3(-)) transporter
MNNITHYLTKTGLYIFYGLLAYMSFHIFISTIIGANLGFLELAKVLKDVVLVVGFLSVLIVSVQQKWFKGWIKSPLVILIGLYGLLTLVVALWRPVDADAEILGVVYNTRFLVFFLYGWLLTKLVDVKVLRTQAIKITLIAGFMVVAFGVFQYLLLPNDALVKLGFTRENGVLPAFFIDDKPDLERVMSTLRDPNSLGAYLLIIGSLLTATWLNLKKKVKPALFGSYAIILALCMFFTFSRSAWLSAVITSILFVWLWLSKGKTKAVLQKVNKTYILVGFGVVAGLMIGLAASWNSYFVQNVIFHADEATVLEDPNELRLRFLNESIQEVADNPLGTGPGSVGVVSSKNDLDTGRLTENYYLQIAGEVGILGLLLFVAIALLVLAKLYGTYKTSKTDSLIAVSLIASFVGISFSGLLNHIWINETVAYVWWGLAALYLTDSRAGKNRTKLT